MKCNSRERDTPTLRCVLNYVVAGAPKQINVVLVLYTAKPPLRDHHQSKELKSDLVSIMIRCFWGTIRTNIKFTTELVAFRGQANRKDPKLKCTTKSLKNSDQDQNDTEEISPVACKRILILEDKLWHLD